jgi:hypothetical protein
MAGEQHEQPSDGIPLYALDLTIAEVAQTMGAEPCERLNAAVDKMMEQWCEYDLLHMPSQNDWRWPCEGGSYYYMRLFRLPIQRFIRLWQIGIPYRPVPPRQQKSDEK